MVTRQFSPEAGRVSLLEIAIENSIDVALRIFADDRRGQISPE